MGNDFEKLESIAKQSLRACYHHNKVVASPTHFSDYWARDSFFAFSGMLGAGDGEQAREVLAFFLSFQREDGKVPRKISRDINSFKYLFGKSIKRKKLYPVYHGLVRPFYAMDSELLLLHGAELYLRTTRDYDFAETHYLQLQKAMHWHIDALRKKGHTLIHEYFLGNWMDTLFKFGPVLYTNILYVQALESMIYIAQIAGRDDDAERYISLVMRVKKEIREKFWNGSYFCDRLSDSSEGTFDLAGNALAVTTGLASDQQRESIVSCLVQSFETRGTFMSVQSKESAWWQVNPIAHIMGISDYHRSTCWLWTLTVVVRAFYANDQEAIAQKMIIDIERVALRDGKVGETYNHDGSEYKKRLWKSATPFAWSSGMILEMLYTCNCRKAHVYDKPEFRIC